MNIAVVLLLAATCLFTLLAINIHQPLGRLVFIRARIVLRWLPGVDYCLKPVDRTGSVGSLFTVNLYLGNIGQCVGPLLVVLPS